MRFEWDFIFYMAFKFIIDQHMGFERILLEYGEVEFENFKFIKKVFYFLSVMNSKFRIHYKQKLKYFLINSEFLNLY